MKLSEAIEEYLKWKARTRLKATARGYMFALRSFAVFVKNKDLEDVTIQEVTEWFDLMETLGWSTNSFIPMTIALRGMFDYYREQGFKVPSSLLVPLPRKVYTRARVVDLETFQRLLACCKNDSAGIRDRAVLWLFWRTGMRNGELCSLNLSDLNEDLSGATIKTEKSQGMKPFRNVFWPKETTYYLKEWLKERERLSRNFKKTDPDALFIAIGGPQAGRRTTISGIIWMFSDLSRKIGVSNPGVNAHSFRHHMGHDLAERGINNSNISGILGHASLASSYRYTDLSAPELEKVYRETFS